MKKLLCLILGFSTIATSFLLNGESAVAVTHRWSFNDLTDSIGSADASLFGGASVSGGSLNLDGINDYANLPIGSTIQNLNNATFETWVTWDTSSTTERWSRVFDFGSNTSFNMFFTPMNGRSDFGSTVDTPRFAIKTTSSGGEQQLNTPNTFPVGVETHVAVTIDGTNNTGILYINGSPVATNSGITIAPSDLGNTTQNFLGRSQYSDPFFDGSISEFRIYDESLSAAQINASYLAGADSAVAVPFELSPTLGILTIGGLFGIAKLRKNLGERKKVGKIV